MIITLLDERLAFVARPRSVVHASATGTQTLCGVDVDTAMQACARRMHADGRLCQRCYRSLRRYGPQFVAVDVEVAGC